MELDDVKRARDELENEIEMRLAEFSKMHGVALNVYIQTLHHQNGRDYVDYSVRAEISA